MNKRAKIIMFLLSFVSLLIPAPNVSAMEAENMPVLIVVNDSMPEAWAGDSANVPLKIKNTSLDFAAENITITPELDLDSPLMPSVINFSKTITKIEPDGEKKIYLSFDVSPNAQEKVYAIKLNIKYYNEYGDLFTNADNDRPDYIYVRITNGGRLSRLNIDEVGLSQPTVQPGQYIDIKLSIGNHGALEAKNIRISLNGLKEDGFSLSRGTNLRDMDDIGGYCTSAVTYSVTPSKKMESGRYGLSAAIEYNDQSGKEYFIEQQFFIPVENGSSGQTTPKIILSRYSNSPTIVKAGQNFTLSLQFLNTNKYKAVHNIKIYLTVPEGGTSGSVFTPVNTSNTFYIDSIPPKGTYEKSLSFFTIPNADPKTYTLTANLEYEDDAGKEYTASDIIGIPVSQQISLDTSDIDIPPEAYAGQALPVGFEFYNTGKAQLRNMMVSLEGNFTTQNGRYFIGNFEAGSSDYYEGIIIPSGPGELKGAIVLSYDDPAGEHEEIRKEFTLNIAEMIEPIPGEIEPDFMGDGRPPGKRTAWAIAGVIAAVAGFVAFRVIRNKKKGSLTLDE